MKKFVNFIVAFCFMTLIELGIISICYFMICFVAWQWILFPIENFIFRLAAIIVIVLNTFSILVTQPYKTINSKGEFK